MLHLMHRRICSVWPGHERRWLKVTFVPQSSLHCAECCMFWCIYGGLSQAQSRKSADNVALDCEVTSDADTLSKHQKEIRTEEKQDDHASQPSASTNSDLVGAVPHRYSGAFDVRPPCWETVLLWDHPEERPPTPYLGPLCLKPFFSRLHVICLRLAC